MSALQKYLAAVRRNYDFLERVRGLDDQMAELEPPSPPYYGGRRHWTRQDRNHVQHEIASDAILESDLTDDEKSDAICDLPITNRRRRINHAVRMCRRGLDVAKALALTEAGKVGGFDTLAPLINELHRAHDHLCANYARELDEHEIDWNQAEWRFDEAFARFAELVPAEAPRHVASPAAIIPSLESPATAEKKQPAKSKATIVKPRYKPGPCPACKSSDTSVKSTKKTLRYCECKSCGKTWTKSKSD